MQNKLFGIISLLLISTTAFAFGGDGETDRGKTGCCAGTVSYGTGRNNADECL